MIPWVNWILFPSSAQRETRQFDSVRIRQELASLWPLRKISMSRSTVDQDLSLLQCRLYLATRYFDIGEKNIIKFNGPSGCGISTPGEQPINTGDKAATNLKINRSPYFSTPLTSAAFLRASPHFLRARGKGRSALFTFHVWIIRWPDLRGGHRGI